MKLHDYLDYDNIQIVTIDGRTCTGFPVSVCYEDETPMGEQQIDIEDKSGEFHGFYESEISEIKIM